MEAIGVALVLVLGLLAGLALVRTRGSTEDVGREIARLDEAVRQGSAHLTERLDDIDRRVAQSQASGREVLQDVFETLGDVQRATATVAEQARTFNSLQDLLRPPKSRGGIGEALLEQLLGQVLPPQAFSLQHRFRSGRIVDAVVRMADRLVPIDAKFPLTNHQAMSEATSESDRHQAERAFASDVERHIIDIASRYIVEDEGTFDFAVMYVPAEGVHADVMRLSARGRPLLEIALEHKVVVLSPLTMYGYLSTVAHGLRCLSIEARAEEILAYCAQLERDLASFAGDYDTLGRHLANAHGKYQEAARKLDRFRTRLERAPQPLDEAASPTSPTGSSPDLELVADA